MKKADAIARWGAEVVETARDYYETDFDKILFAEDMAGLSDDIAEMLYPASEFDVYERCSRAYFHTHGHWHAPDLMENIRNNEGHMVTPKYDISWDQDEEASIDVIVQAHKVISKVLLLSGRTPELWWSELAELQYSLAESVKAAGRIEEVHEHVMSLLNDPEITKQMWK